MALDLGELLLHIRADSSEAESSVSSIGDKLQSGLKGAAEVATAAIATATTAVVGFAASSVQVGMDFDSAMSQVAATMGTTTDQIGDLRDFALEMGSATSFSATQAAEALNYMALAGYDADESMEMLPNVLNLAAAGGMELATASDMVTDAQSALGLTMDETTTMVDQMAKTSSKTNTSVSQLGDAILTIGATAKTVKGGTAELNQVLGLLADNGIKGSEGGTHLRNVIMSLQNPTDKAAASLENLGVSAYDNEGNFRSLEDIFMDLQGSLDGLTEEERQQALAAIFNKTDLASVNALLNTDKERWDEVAGAIDDCTGAAEDMANTQLDNLSGDITLFQSALEGAQIAISDSLTPTLREFVQFGTDAISTLSTAFQEGGLTGAMDALGTILSEGLAMVIAELPNMINAGMQLLGALGEGLLANIDTIIQAAVDIVGVLLDGLISALPSLVEGAFQLIGSLASGIGEALPELIPKAVEAVTTFLTALTNSDNMSNIIKGATDLITGLVEGLVQAIPQLIEAAPQIIMGLVTALVENIPTIFDCGVQILQGLLDGIVSLVTSIPSVIKSVFDAIVDGIKSLFGIHSPSTVMKEIGVNVIQGMLDGISDTWGKITDFFSEKIGALKDFVSEKWNDIKEKTTEVWNNIKEKTSEVWGNIKESLSETVSNIKEQVSEKWTDLKEKVTEIGTNLKEKIQETWENTKEKVTETVDNIKEKVNEKWTDLKEKVTEVGDNLKEKISETWDNTKEKVTETVENIKEQVSEKWTSLKEKVSDIGTNLKEKIQDTWDQTKEKVSSIVDNIKETISDKWTNIKEKVSDLSSQIKENVSNKWTEIKENIKEKVTDAYNTVKEKFSDIKTSVSEKMSDVKDYVSNKWDEVKDKLGSADLASAARSAISSFKDGLSSAWTSVTSWASSAISSLKNSLSNAISTVKSKVSGSHRTGLQEVPYDGYIAELHQGERVLTAAENNFYENLLDKMKNNGNNGGSIVINFDGNYQFRDTSDIDYFMSEAGKLIRRKAG